MLGFLSFRVPFQCAAAFGKEIKDESGCWECGQGAVGSAALSCCPLENCHLAFLLPNHPCYWTLQFCQGWGNRERVKQGIRKNLLLRETKIDTIFCSVYGESGLPAN